MGFLLEKEYEMLSNPDFFQKSVHLTPKEAQELGYPNPQGIWMQRALWNLAEGFTISVIFGTDTIGFSQGLFEAALMKDGRIHEGEGFDRNPAGYLTEYQTEKLLQTMKAKHGVKK